jgi:hypothetical protein
LGSISGKLRMQYKFLWYFFTSLKLCIHFDKKRVGLTLGDFFSNLSGHTERETDGRERRTNLSSSYWLTEQTFFHASVCPLCRISPDSSLIIIFFSIIFCHKLWDMTSFYCLYLPIAIYLKKWNVNSHLCGYITTCLGSLCSLSGTT